MTAHPPRKFMDLDTAFGIVLGLAQQDLDRREDEGESYGPQFEREQLAIDLVLNFYFNEAHKK